jgi:predicted PurR-regulated permease PerM
VQSRAGEVAEAAVTHTPAAAFSLLSGVTASLLLLVTAAFLVASPGVYQSGVRTLVPREYEEAFDQAWGRLTHALRRWVGGISVAMLLMGAFTAIGLGLAGINGWLALGLLTGMATFVPYVGALASAVPGLLVALSQGTQHLLYALLVYVGVHLVEGYVIEPLVMKRALKLKPAVLLFGQALSGALFGVLGVAVAAPLLVCVQELVTYLYVERRLGKGPAGPAVV